MSSPVQHISKCMVKPADKAAAVAKSVHLSAWDLGMFNCNYIEKGLLFSNHTSSPLPPIHHVIDRLKSSLSAALLHFYPLAGRLLTEPASDGLHVSIDCSCQGAEFVHASADGVTVAQVLAPSQDVPSLVNSFFPYNYAISHDGHSIPLLAVQLTELADGFFVALCFNHAVGDGTSFWHFFNSWAEIARSDGDGLAISRPPVHDRWFIDDGEAPPIKLPYSDPSEFIDRFVPPPLRERYFHFSSRSIAKLKEKANEESKHDDCVISSFQALSALVWRSITRARRLPKEQRTSCRLMAQCRARLQPPLSPDYVGNSLYLITSTTTAGELLSNSLGWAAVLLNRAVQSHNGEAILRWTREYQKKLVVWPTSSFDRERVLIGSSPRFDVYGCDFGWGKAVGLRSGPGNKSDGKVSSYQGREGGGSVDLEVCLLPEYMAALELDEELMDAVSLTEEE